MSSLFDPGDYILGTDNDEVKRLGLQHLVWRPRASDAWRRAGFTVGQHLVDVGCGPGYASLDLAAIAGPGGRVTAIDRAPLFLDVLSRRIAQSSIGNVDLLDIDLDGGLLPGLSADGAWCRWVFAFLKEPRELLRGVRKMLRPGGTLVIHEYFDYGTWRLVPRSTDIEELVEVVKKSWRADGGEPDIALDLVAWLPTEGFRIVELRPIIDVISPSDFAWQWPATFVDVGLDRLVKLGYFSAGRADEIRDEFRRYAAEPGSRMITPGVLEIIATRE